MSKPTASEIEIVDRLATVVVKAVTDEAQVIIKELGLVEKPGEPSPVLPITIGVSAVGTALLALVQMSLPTDHAGRARLYARTVELFDAERRLEEAEALTGGHRSSRN